MIKRKIKELEVLKGVVDTSLFKTSYEHLAKVLSKELKEVDQKIEDMINSNISLSKQYDLLLSVRGIGKRLAVGI